jgi:Mannosyltransferase (PIG-V)
VDARDQPGGDQGTPAAPVNAPTSAPTARWWVASRTGVWIALSRIVAGVVVGHAAVVLFPQSVLHTRLGTLSNGAWLEVFDRWDARYYLTIATHGYPAHAPGVRAFFPGYPLVVQVVHVLTGGLLTFPQAACLVSMTAFIAAAGLLYRLVASRFTARTALISTLLFCWFPTSVFFLAPYSEALFALEILVVATLVDKGRWWWAALVAGYASATSPESVALTGALVVAALVAHRSLRRTVGYALVGSFGAVAYVAFLGLRFGKPLAFADALPGFHRVVMVPLVGMVENIGAIHQVLTTPHSPITGIRHLTTTALWSNVVWMWLVDDIALLLAVCALITLITVSLRHRRDTGAPFEYPVPIFWMVLLAVIIATASATVIHAPGGPVSTEAVARLVSVAFPLYVGLTLMVRRWRAPVVAGLALSIAAALVTQVLFNLGYWVT